MKMKFEIGKLIYAEHGKNEELINHVTMEDINIETDISVSEIITMLQVIGGNTAIKTDEIKPGIGHDNPFFNALVEMAKQKAASGEKIAKENIDEAKEEAEEEDKEVAGCTGNNMCNGDCANCNPVGGLLKDLEKSGATVIEMPNNGDGIHIASLCMSFLKHLEEEAGGNNIHYLERRKQEQFEKKMTPDEVKTDKHHICEGLVKVGEHKSINPAAKEKLKSMGIEFPAVLKFSKADMLFNDIIGRNIVIEAQSSIPDVVIMCNDMTSALIANADYLLEGLTYDPFVSILNRILHKPFYAYDLANEAATASKRYESIRNSRATE